MSVAIAVPSASSQRKPASTSGATPDALLAMLDAADWRIDAIEQALPSLRTLGGAIRRDARLHWIGGLRRAYPQLRELPLVVGDDLLALLRTLCDWPLYLALCDVFEDEANTRRYADALLRSGRLDDAFDVCRWRLLAAPHDADIGAMHAHLQQWRRFIGARASPIEGDPLRLDPLGHHHREDFVWQYWDPDIARRCCLPDFRSDLEWHRWLDACWGYGDQMLYAVVHREWGFVGSVSLTLHGRLGFFYYWIGRDFQGHGLGPAAVRLLLEDAFSRHGMTTCYAKVYEDNLASRKALTRIGFEALDFRPAPPYGDEMFYRLGESQPRERSVDDLRELFERMHSDTRVAVPCASTRAAPNVPSSTNPQWSAVE